MCLINIVDGENVPSSVLCLFSLGHTARGFQGVSRRFSSPHGQQIIIALGVAMWFRTTQANSAYMILSWGVISVCQLHLQSKLQQHKHKQNETYLCLVKHRNSHMKDNTITTKCLTLYPWNTQEHKTQRCRNRQGLFTNKSTG